MKKYCFYLFAMLFSIQIIQAQQGISTGPAISFAQLSHDFGEIKHGEKVEKSYVFTNSGSEPLVVSEVVTTCGCTATKWSKEPILPGKSGEILVTFNSEGKEGRQNKVITIISNASNSPSRINLITNVIAAGK